MDFRIERSCPEDQDAIWKIIEQVIAKGDTYAFAPDSSKEDMLDYWVGEGTYSFVAKAGDDVVGTFVIKNNQPKLGAHIANAAYMVHPVHHRKGIGRKMGEASLQIAKELGYRAMQFNLVVKTNEPAVALWQKLGFEIIGEIPEAFHHQQLGFVNAYIMHRKL